MDPLIRTATRLAIPVFIGASVLQSSIYDVRGGTRAVIFDRLQGVKETVVNEGTHFLVPWLQRSIIFDVRTKPRNIATTTGSKDLQMVSLTLRVLHRPDVKSLPKIYQVRPRPVVRGLPCARIISWVETNGMGKCCCRSIGVSDKSCGSIWASSPRRRDPQANTYLHRTSVPTTTSVFSPPSATKS